MAEISAAVAGVATVLYALLGGADFGGGVWDVFARGPRKAEQRSAIAHAMGPVWEANHVWLIFVIVILFTAFPVVYSALSIALLTLAGEIHRGDVGRAAVLAPAMLIGYGASRFVAHFLDRGYVRPVVLSFSAVASVALLVTELFA